MSADEWYTMEIGSVHALSSRLNSDSILGWLLLFLFWICNVVSGSGTASSTSTELKNILN